MKRETDRYRKSRRLGWSLDFKPGSMAGGIEVATFASAARFYEAEDYHQDYFRRNSNAPYCSVVIKPKLKKLGL